MEHKTNLQLVEPVSLKYEPFRPISVIDRNAVLRVNTSCTISGWGNLEFDISGRKLRMANVTVLDLKRCQDSYPNLPEKVLCVGSYEGGIDACQVKKFQKE